MTEKLIGWDDDGIFLILEENGEEICAVPDFADMTLAELQEYCERITEKIHSMDETEPKQKSGEKREAWEELHEDLEDIRDEVLEYIDEWM